MNRAIVFVADEDTVYTAKKVRNFTEKLKKDPT
jgi:hypothetical protein